MKSLSNSTPSKNLLSPKWAWTRCRNNSDLRQMRDCLRFRTLWRLDARERLDYPHERTAALSLKGRLP